MKVVFFDGHCSICNASVDWLMKVDKTGELKFASLQGETASKLLGHAPGKIDFDTVVYLRDGEKFERSTAILKILADSGSLWRLSSVFLAIPTSLRDVLYKLVAKNRYRFIKRRETCRLPTQEERGRLLP